MQTKILHIIEPTLFDQSGHGFSYVKSILSANAKHFMINVWVDKRAEDLFMPTTCNTKLYFIRKLRQLQKIFLYYKLITTNTTIFVSTANLWDLKIFTFLNKYFNSKARVILHFHQFKQSTKKLRTLRKLAFNSRIEILTPTEKLSRIFSACGFKHCEVIPCPTFYPQRSTTSNEATFNNLLYAGAARSDKGFPLVIELLAYLRKQNDNTKFNIQISTPNSQRYDKESANAIQDLGRISKINLTLYQNTLLQDEYLNLFNNAICLLLYDKDSYKDKFSGIALDAFYAGCPIITARDTWMGDTATKYCAGIALDNYNFTTIKAAIDKIIDNYAYYHENAKKAAEILQKLHDPANTLLYLSK